MYGVVLDQTSLYQVVLDQTISVFVGPGLADRVEVASLVLVETQDLTDLDPCSYLP